MWSRDRYICLSLYLDITTFSGLTVHTYTYTYTYIYTYIHICICICICIDIDIDIDICIYIYIRFSSLLSCSRHFLRGLLLNGARLKLFYLFYDKASLRSEENRLYLSNILGSRKRPKYKLSQRTLRWRHRTIKD